MPEKKHTRRNTVNQQKGNIPLHGKPLGSEKKNSGQSFWQRLLEDKPRLFLYQCICVFLVAFCVFANSIPNGYNIDDTYYTTTENTIANQGVKSIKQIFTSSTLHDVSNNSFDYRPIPMLSFALQHQFLGSAPAIGHFINVFIYSLLCILIFTLLSRWFGETHYWFAFFVTLLYAVHPLHTEVVSSIKSRDELLATLFCMLSILSLWKWHISGKIHHIIFSGGLFILGLLCKTTITPYLGIMLLVPYFFIDKPLKNIVFPVIIIFGLFLATTILQNHFAAPDQKRIFLYFENPMFVEKLPLAIKTATISYILGWYAYLHVIPYPLSFYYGYEYVSLLNWGHIQPILAAILYLLLGYLAIRNFRKKSITAFAALYYLCCIIPFSNLLGPAPGMMAERFTFASTLGYCMLLVSALYYLFKISPGFFTTAKNNKYLLATFLCIFIAYAGMSIARNKEWKDSWTLYSHDIQHLESSAKANMLYGEQVIRKTNYWREMADQTSGLKRTYYLDSVSQYLAEEKKPFLRVLAISPDYTKAINNLAVAYIHADSFDLAKKFLQRAISLTTVGNEDAIAYYNLGLVYSKLSRQHNNSSFLDSSTNAFKKTTIINPKYIKAYKMIALNHMTQKDTAAAVDVLLSGIKNIPDQSFLYMELGLLYIYKGDTVKAVNYYAKGGEVPNPDPLIFKMLQNYYRGKNDKQKEDYYTKKLKAATNQAN